MEIGVFDENGSHVGDEAADADSCIQFYPKVLAAQFEKDRTMNSVTSRTASLDCIQLSRQDGY